jgi:ABC-type transport system involved in multi-copper enzyme maturation permease subunit
MIKEIILKEIKLSLLSFRFWSVFLFIIIIFITGSIIVCKKYQNEIIEYSKKQKDYVESLGIAKNGIGELFNKEIPVIKKPMLVNMFAFNREGNYPKTIAILPRIPQTSEFSGLVLENGNRNYKLEKYVSFDFIFIIGIILSFLAIVLSFDTFSKEREEGILKLLLSNSISRIKVIISNYIAITSMLILTLIFGILIYIIIFQIILGQNLLFLFPAEVFLILIISVIYLSIFVWISFAISSIVSRSQTSLAVLLLIWTFITILSPYLGGMVIKRYYPVASKETFEKQNRALFKMIIEDKSPKEYMDLYMGVESAEGWKVIDKWSEWAEESFTNFSVKRYNELFNQAVSGENINNYLSPFSSFRSIVESVSNTGLKYNNKFFNYAKQYREEIRSYIKAMDLSDNQSKHRLYFIPQIQSISIIPVNPAGIPRFNMSASNLIENLENNISSLLYLLVLNIIFCFLSVYSFTRMDVR